MWVCNRPLPPEETCGLYARSIRGWQRGVIQLITAVFPILKLWYLPEIRWGSEIHKDKSKWASFMYFNDVCTCEKETVLVGHS